MLEPRHIVRMRINMDRIRAHDAMPKPSHVIRALTGQFAVLGDAVIAELLHVTPADFKRQLAVAREHGVEFIGTDKDRNQIGISATTSLIRSGTVLSKRVMVPHDFMNFDKSLKDHIVIGAFVRGEVVDGRLSRFDDSVEIAGWTTVRDVEWLQRGAPPQTFQSKLQVTAFPCVELQPIETLFKQIGTTSITI